ncbi:MAG: P1 family peptidase [Chloroflexi bacterium]|jgi:L-aminopeptidase/D-esterase-like protein|nr:P1 family peptidase [Chloroflexota bacterium]
MSEANHSTELAPGALTDVPGLEVGHATNLITWTGCTVVLAREGAIAGGVVRGLAPGTRETDLLRPATLVEKAHGILLTGGSAFGLAAADGVMRYLEEHGIGYDAGGVRVPIVPGAVLFDLGIGDSAVRPDATMGYAACQAANSKDQSQGNVGAGTGATVGKLMGIGKAMKGGLGQASVRAGHLIVAALMAVNAFGDVIDPASGQIIAGARNLAGDGFLDTAQAMRHMIVRNVMAFKNTVIGVVATNAQLDVAQTNELAWAAHDGLARAVRPSHSLYDGDAIFGLSTGKVRAHQALVSDMAAEATTLAILNAVRAAEKASGLPSARSWQPGR